ncbi:MAG: class I SAM-dependent DNA methyltransferase [Bernardetiaceae bacterium]|nr:class I SAM-dependent DNA methyltransferase [Bernardetiaceae bacterium]
MKLALEVLNIKQSLNTAYLKRKVFRDYFDVFKTQFVQLLERIDEQESEEHAKNLLADFLKNSFYHKRALINTKGRADLVIHNDLMAEAPVAVLMELKKPTNKAEMPSPENINTKALHELLLYYLRQREEAKNDSIKHLIITNVYEWFVFDAQEFERVFYKNTTLRKAYKDWSEGKKTSTNTDHFYNEIAKPLIDEMEGELKMAYFDLRTYRKLLDKDETKLIALYKVFSPDHLLKDFQYDSNHLDRGFYEELLHIMGLEEVEQNGLVLIKRKPEGRRDSGSILENTIRILTTHRKVEYFHKRHEYGKTLEEQIHSIGLALCIMWVNRLLFLKLLEGQLMAFHKGHQAQFRFVDRQTLSDYDEVYKLFFEVLAIKEDERLPDFRKNFAHVPYLNSSLFEVSELEAHTISINALNNKEALPYYKNTALVDSKGKRKIGKRPSLEYFLDFLDAYDFAADGTEEIQKYNKRLINASVLGLIFEKINGYQDGSFFTPGFVTMYMAREALRQSVLDKFNTRYNWNCKDFKSLYNRLERIELEEANALINEIKICDPAVGSGHFLVSVLNEMLAIKSDLGLLLDKEGRLLRGYRVVVENDELAITDVNGDVFDYQVSWKLERRNVGKENHRVQETIFQEKKYIIENCLFGVDLNPNSVKICRLRLWIELLKHTFYKAENNFQDLEILPNLDINIKQGNSLISRFAIDADLKMALRKSNWTISSYQSAVATYRKATVFEEKQQLKTLIAEIKSSFSYEISRNDPERKKLNKLKGELQNLVAQRSFLGLPDTERSTRLERKKELQALIQSIETNLEERENQRHMQRALEWRFEFPEVLNDNGDFRGFDIVIGNPPYFALSQVQEMRFLKAFYETYEQTGDIYCLFYELAHRLVAKDCIVTMITSNKWMRAAYGRTLRKFLLEKFTLERLVDLNGNKVFDSATVDTNILQVKKTPPPEQQQVKASLLPKLEDIEKEMDEAITKHELILENLSEQGWIVAPQSEYELKEKIANKGLPLKDWNIKIYFGVKTGYNKAFIIDSETKDKLIQNDSKSAEIIKPILRGRDVRRYTANFADLYLINTHNGYGETPRINVEKYPAIKAHLDQFYDKLTSRYDKGATPYNLRSCAYLNEFEKEKIIYSEIVQQQQFYYDESRFYVEATNFLMTGENLKYLIAMLNSNFITWAFKKFYAGGGLGEKGFRYKKAFLAELPIPQISEVEQQPFVEKVDAILERKRRDAAADTSDLEAQIDAMVYQLYGLSKAEIQIVEGG